MNRNADTASGAQVRLRKLGKAYGTIVAVDDVSLEIPAGAFVSLLGPSGSGKTTTLNLIAGFLAPDRGEIFIDERPVDDVPSHKRDIGMVFQSYSLFPHMTVADNVGFPLRMRTRLSRIEARKRVAEILALMQLSQYESRYPRQLSGGQQQRVAIARALVSRPRLLLMDEPLGALDKNLRAQMQAQIRRIHHSVGTTIIYVTHDQSEALTMSDLVVVMHRARIAQIGTPRALYESPASVFVADFLGESNLIAGTVMATDSRYCTVKTTHGAVIHVAPARFSAAPGERVFVLIRPEDMIARPVQPAEPDAGTACERLFATVKGLGFHGDYFNLDAAIGDEVVKVRVPRAQSVCFETGRQVLLTWAHDTARLLPAGCGAETAAGGAP
jgi:ABC-type Fe3+/spermidine/putrescine transport system ATPase subunit